ncbi:4-hydroxy-tetrahydrodipicolinate reductase [Candidatus Protochlamydia phocaeensis]|uniref:4-hydroxy-tetrahydrodipicolinate reductase n=1 Tax=Candidatus Protochlamydia phocaeensis TaxID=1414722 RepID=UPI00083928E6|nr:4-hydroxy-tetrahydrodipicolinate reductase [Candidatus Protochlamydia phocaeensis]
MKIALMGYGKMGRLIEQFARQRGHEIVAIISSQTKDSAEQLEKAEIAIDFSHASCVLGNLQLCIQLNKSLVIGTTGWDAHFTQAKQLIAHSTIGCLYSPNFSIGIHLFKHMVAYAAQLMSAFTHYDVSGIEYHHSRKADAPSGTAKALTEELQKHMPERTNLQFSSIRCGSIPGTHTLLFDSEADTITLTHQARNREGFAQGAVMAAEWLNGKRGFFTLDDMLPHPYSPLKS